MKTKTIKMGAIILAMTMAVSALSGCGETKDENKDGKVSISLSMWPDQDVDPAGYQAYADKVAKFNELYPDIEVLPENYDFSTETFYAKAESGDVPTITAIPFTEAAKIIRYGYAADITEQFKEAGFYDNVSDFVLKNITYQDKVYLMPISVYSLGLGINLDLCEKAGLLNEDGSPKVPSTYDELTQMAVQIKEKTGVPGFQFTTTNNAGGWFFTALAWGFGTEFMKEVDGKWTATFNSSECVAALQWLKDMKWKYDVMPTNTLVNNSDAMQTFGSGQVGMTFTAPNFIPMYAGYGMKKDSFGLANLPAGPKERVSLMGGAYYIIKNNATQEEIDAAMKWIQFDGVSLDLTEDVKNNIRSKYETQVENDKLVGVKDINIWSDECEFVKYQDEVIDELTNVNPAHLAAYNDKSGMNYRAEEPVCAQDLYGLLDSCIQEVLNNKDADCAEILEKANADFQRNFLDYEN